MKKSEKRTGTLVLQSGERFPLIGETDLFWVCQGTQFRKSNPAVREILPAEEKRKQEEQPAEAKE